MSAVEDTARVWLESLYLRLLAPDHASWTDEERRGLVARNQAAIEHDMGTLRELVTQGQVEVETQWRARLHAAEGLDHEMIDEAIEFATPEGP